MEDDYLLMLAFGWTWQQVAEIPVYVKAFALDLLRGDR